MFGPSLCLLYINDMPDSIDSNVRLFADDMIMYLYVSEEPDCQTLQTNLSNLEKWENV